MINITFKPNTLELEIKGHSEHNEKGEDIVCAAISTLFYTLGQALYDSKEMLKEEPIFKDEEGNGIICCTPKEEYQGNISLIYMTILTGMQLVAENYKENVSFEVRG